MSSSVALPIVEAVDRNVENEVVLEGYLLKQVSRLSHVYWHPRYFEFYADHTLRYFQEKPTLDDLSIENKCRGSFFVSDTSGADISDLFVQKNHKKLIYCFRISFSNPNVNNVTDSGIEYAKPDDDSISSNDELMTLGGESKTGTDGNRFPPATAAKEVTNDKSISLLGKPSSLQHKRAKSTDSHLAQHNISPRLHQRNASSTTQQQQQSIDGESLTMESRLRGRWFQKAVLNQSTKREGAGTEIEPELTIPESIRVEQNPIQRASSNEFYSRGAVTVPQKNGHTAFLSTRRRNDEEDEQDYLGTEYLTAERNKQRKFKQTLVQGSKLAVAVGAGVGVTLISLGVAVPALIALAVAGAAGGSGAASAAVRWGGNRSELVLASADYETAKLWKSILDAALASDTVQRSTWGQMFASDGRTARSAVLPSSIKKPNIPNRECSFTGSTHANCGQTMFGNNARWTAVEGGILALIGSGYQTLRIFRESSLDTSIHCQPNVDFHDSPAINKISVDGKPCPPMKASTVISTSPLDAFLCLMSHGKVQKKGQKYYCNPNMEHRATFEVIERFDEHTDIIHLQFQPLFLFPFWTACRDFVLYRYWRLEPDGSYVVCFESVDHASYLVNPKTHVRGDMHAVFNISPLKKSMRRQAIKLNQQCECLMTATVQVDPKGWVPTSRWSLFSNQSYGDAFAIAALLQLVDIRDAIDQDRFVPFAMDETWCVPVQDLHGSEEASVSRMDGGVLLQRALSTDTADDTLHEDRVNYDFSYVCNESTRQTHDRCTGLIATPPSLMNDMWAEPDANSFRVRGPSYKVDRRKYNAGSSIGNLVAVDVVSVDKPLYSGFTMHPTERIQLALQQEAALVKQGRTSDMPEFVFVVNICLPGPPFYHGVFYYAINDRSTIDGSNGTPSSKLCHKFFFGDDDGFRDRTFKLIPQIVQGNFIVRKTVGSTPAIMGKKLRQLYVKSDRFFEVVLDCGSSPVATGVIRLSLGYAKSLVVDMGFLFEGDENEYLPERIFGCVRMKNMEFGPNLRHVIAPDVSEEEE